MTSKNINSNSDFYTTILNELKVSTNLTKIRNKLNISKQDLNYHLKKLIKYNKIEKTSYGNYKVIEINNEEKQEVENNIDDLEEYKLIKKEDLLNELNKYCYFCDFAEVTPHLHHIIRIADKGLNLKNNLLPLCPNHHELIHRRIYVLGFNPKTGYYFLKNRTNGEIVYQSERQNILKRKMPLSSINKSNNLRIKGDLNTKAVISVLNLRQK